MSECNKDIFNSNKLLRIKGINLLQNIQHIFFSSHFIVTFLPTSPLPP